MEKEKIKLIIEALFFASHEPLTEKKLAEVLEGMDKKSLREALEELKREYREKENLEIKEVAGGYQIFTRPDYAPWIEKLHKTRPTRLSQAALETLAMVAYNQPVIRAEIESIRGVDTSGVLHTLLEKNLIKILGRKKVIGRPLLYGITDDFLKYFGLKDINELPSVEEVKEMIP
jgi:segregation and condensation protein B